MLPFCSSSLPFIPFGSGLPSQVSNPEPPWWEGVGPRRLGGGLRAQDGEQHCLVRGTPGAAPAESALTLRAVDLCPLAAWFAQPLLPRFTRGSKCPRESLSDFSVTGAVGVLLGWRPSFSRSGWGLKFCVSKMFSCYGEWRPLVYGSPTVSRE